MQKFEQMDSTKGQVQEQQSLKNLKSNRYANMKGSQNGSLSKILQGQKVFKNLVEKEKEVFVE